ncbi:MAG: hypothetical protein IIA92_09830 [Chloroflexi bacterium]|nr:hypothetical protein [Chloroflexota bacterium]
MGLNKVLTAGFFALLTVVIAVTANTAVNNIPKPIQPYLEWSWPFLGVITVLFVVFSVMQARRTPRQYRRRQVTKIIEELIEEGLPQQPRKHEPEPLIPKPPEPFFAHRYPMQENFTGRVREREMLTQWLMANEHPVLVLTAIGGMGKSALTWVWLQCDVLGRHLPGLSDETVEGLSTTRLSDGNRPHGALWWSFYNTESRFSAFLDRALSYISSGEIDPYSISSSYEKAQALVGLIQQHNILLVLDGFERELRAYASLMAAYHDEDVAESEGDQSRSCSDPAASVFLRGIASGELKGRVLLTSRLYPEELEGRTGQRKEDLNAMDPEDAITFFHAQGVVGTRAEVQAACAPYGYHPLALRLLAGVIVRDHLTPGDIRVAERNAIPPRLRDRDQRHHILQVSYDALDRPKRELLSKVSAFRSAVDFQTIDSVFGERGRADTGLMAAAGRILLGAILRGGPADVDADLSELTNRGLLFREGGRFDLHPVVRQYAYDRLAKKKETHTTLMDYFAEMPIPNEYQVKTIEDLSSVIELYHHTIGAQRHDKAWELFAVRISRPNRRLGAYDTMIELLRSLFPDGEKCPPKLKSAYAQAWAKNALGISYSITGQPRRACSLIELANNIQETINASKADIISGLQNLTFDQFDLGELVAAEKNLRRCIQISTEIDDDTEAEYEGAISHNELSKVLAYIGAFEQAAQESDKAFNSLNKLGSNQSVGMIWAHRTRRAMLLGQGTIALEAATQNHQVASSMGDERDIVRAEWLLGATLTTKWLESKEGQNKSSADAESHLAEALTRSRRLNLGEFEPDILLARARWDQVNGDALGAREQAQEALAIADRSEYRLKQADIHNFLARLSLDEGASGDALIHAEAARERAWCDGPPHAYQSALDEAEQMLEELGQGD